MATNNNTADIGFEKQIWDAACVLRGNLDAAEYKSVDLFNTLCYNLKCIFIFSIQIWQEEQKWP